MFDLPYYYHSRLYILYEYLMELPQHNMILNFRYFDICIQSCQKVLGTNVSIAIFSICVHIYLQIQIKCKKSLIHL